MSAQPTIGGDPVTLPDFSAFKAIHAMDIVGEVEQSWRGVLDGAAAFQDDYAKKHVVRLSRAEARRQYRPKPLYRARNVVGEDDRVTEVIEEPVLEADGKTPVLGADPLGHLTDQDWQASANELVIPERPSDDLVIAAMIPLAFKLARAQVLQLIALALTPNRQLEEWDEQGQPINALLDQEGKKILHRAKAEELVRLAVAVAQKCKDQLGGPFEEAAAAFKELWPNRQEETTSSTEPPAMEVETDDSGSKPESSTESEGATDGPQTSSSTRSATGG